MNNLNQLIDELLELGVLRTPAINQALRQVDRQNFVPRQLIDYAYDDTALPLEHGSTISQPRVVAFMLELLTPRAGEKILDIGAGSGWTTAILACLVGPTGEVIGVEIEPEIIKFGRENLAKYNFPRARIETAKNQLGWPSAAPFDKILVSAAVMQDDTEQIPSVLLKQLKNPGAMVIPVDHSIFLIKKDTDGRIMQTEFPGFIFVPLQY